IQSWNSQDYRDCKALRFSNRYLTSPQHAQGEMPIPFGPEVDPLNILQRIADQHGLLHLDDNKVFYYEKQLSSNNKSTYRQCSPSNILCGLAVEVQVSFVALPVKTSYKMVHKLHSVCIISRLAEIVTNSGLLLYTILIIFYIFSEISTSFSYCQRSCFLTYKKDEEKSWISVGRGE
ncbi:hypothetical protein K474DRAFT_1610519, partial [Panus rudis PR-1116 ss-1]